MSSANVKRSGRSQKTCLDIEVLAGKVTPFSVEANMSSANVKRSGQSQKTAWMLRSLLEK